MNPPGWPAPKPRHCPCDTCHSARYVDLAYALGKNRDDEWETSPDAYGTADLPTEESA